MSTPEPGPPLRSLQVTAIVLAAGQGRRFATADPGAGPKLLAGVSGVPILEVTTRTLRLGGATSVVLVLAADASDALRRLAAGLADRVVVNPDPLRGMLSSVQVGLAAADALPDVCLIMPADMPFARVASVAAVVAAASSGRTVSPRYRGRGGHPVALSAGLRDRVAQAAATGSLKPLLYADDPWLLDVDDPGILRDVDVPADLAD